jgi:hypothetical protein
MVNPSSMVLYFFHGSVDEIIVDWVSHPPFGAVGSYSRRDRKSLEV